MYIKIILIMCVYYVCVLFSNCSLHTFTKGSSYPFAKSPKPCLYILNIYFSHFLSTFIHTEPWGGHARQAGWRVSLL